MDRNDTEISTVLISESAIIDADYGSLARVIYVGREEDTKTSRLMLGV